MADGSAQQAGPAASGREPPLYRKAFGILAGRIVRGEMPAGTRLQESHVAESFGISRAPARKALTLLEEKGLVSKHESRGYEVAANPPSDTLALSTTGAGSDIQLSTAATWQQIYSEVESEIIARISFGSWRISEAELARYHRVSRTVARDVMGRLQQRGLVQKDERSRWFAPALTPEHVSELYELRWTLEPLALRKAAPKIPPALLGQIRSRLKAAIATPETVDGDVLNRLEEDLHICLLHHCGNRALLQAITLPQSLLIAHKFLYRWTPQLFASEPFLPEHDEIIGRLADGQVDAAARSLEQHLRLSLDRAIKRVDWVTARFQPDGLPYLEILG